MTRLKRLFPAAALCAALALAAGCGGGTNPAELTPGPPTTDLHLVARNVRFDKKALAAPANSELHLTFANEDAGMPHNVAVYKDKSARDKVWAGELFNGRDTESYTFQAPPPGQYFFRCDAHPDMNGMLYVQ
jgi:plastocyanin